MKNRQYIKMGISVIALCMMASGCASTAAVRQAKQEAQNAQITANEAKEMAMNCTTRSERTEEMVNRSFKKSMYK